MIRIPKGTIQRTIEIPQCARIFKASCCLRVHNAHLKFFCIPCSITISLTAIEFLEMIT